MNTIAALLGMIATEAAEAMEIELDPEHPIERVESILDLTRAGMSVTDAVDQLGITAEEIEAVLRFARAGLGHEQEPE